MTTHATLSPSAADRWRNCPGSVRMVAQYPSGGSSGPAAIDGTHSHTLLEKCILNNDVSDPQQFLGQTLTDHDGSFVVDQSRIDRVRIATDYIQSKMLDGVKLFSERRVNPAGLFGRDDLSGTVDITIVNGGHREIIDYKDGMNPVDVVNNMQLEQYVFGDLSEQLASHEPVEKYTTTIIQPKMLLKGLPAISSVTNYVTHFLARVQAFQADVEATNAPDAPLVPGDKQCRYCAHRGACTVASTALLDKAGITFDDMSLVKDAAKADPKTMTNEQLAELVIAAPMFRKMLDAVEETALDRIRSGNPVPGLKVVRGNGRNAWAKTEDEVAQALLKMRVPKGSIYETKIVSAPQALKLRWAKRDGTPQQLTEKQLKLLTTDFIENKGGKETVVPESDRRDAIVYGNVSTMFTPVPETGSYPSWLS